MSVHLEVPARRHERAFLQAVEASRRLHRGFVAPPKTAEQFRAYLGRLSGPANLGHFVCLADGGLAGVINLNEIVRGGFRSAYLGYYAFEPHAGHGHMTAGLRLVVSRAFRQHRLHRLEANILPGNLPSLALVERLGFRLEGYSPRYLRIAGRWRDHERWALTIEDWRAKRSRRA
jgi:ribosomal-protein-alanine N-acetyltransferase